MNPWSNSPPGYPDTSSGGYPLFYAIGGDGKPVGAPRLVYDGQTFTDEAELEDYKKRSKARDVNLEDWRRRFETEVHHGINPATDLTLVECWLLWDVARKKDDSFWRRMLSGTNAEINRVKNAGFYTIPTGWTKALFPRGGSIRWDHVAEIWE